METLPYEQTVDIDVTKQRPDATIHLIFNGGIGEEYVQSIMMRVTRPEGPWKKNILPTVCGNPARMMNW